MIDGVDDACATAEASDNNDEAVISHGEDVTREAMRQLDMIEKEIESSAGVRDSDGGDDGGGHGDVVAVGEGDVEPEEEEIGVDPLL